VQLRSPSSKHPAEGQAVSALALFARALALAAVLLSAGLALWLRCGHQAGGRRCGCSLIDWNIDLVQAQTLEDRSRLYVARSPH